jgi:hypothetical protein
VSSETPEGQNNASYFRQNLMNWQLILSLSLLGVVMGLVSVFGFMGNQIWVLWLCMAAFCAWQFARKTRHNLFLHGFYLGIFVGVCASWVQAIFLPTYISNNPQMVEAINDLPHDLHPAFVLLIMGPIIGAASGIIVGLFALIAGKIVRGPISDYSGS